MDCSSSSPWLPAPPNGPQGGPNQHVHWLPLELEVERRVDSSPWIHVPPTSPGSGRSAFAPGSLSVLEVERRVDSSLWLPVPPAGPQGAPIRLSFSHCQSWEWRGGQRNPGSVWHCCIRYAASAAPHLSGGQGGLLPPGLSPPCSRSHWSRAPDNKGFKEKLVWATQQPVKI